MYVFITVYNRQDNLSELIKKLNYDKIVVIDDHSNPPLQAPCEIIRTPQNNGKAGFWKNINLIFNYVKQNDINYFMIIPDDYLPYSKWKDILSLFQYMEKYDKKAVAMSVTHRRWRDKCWTGFNKKIVQLRNKGFYQTQYVDGDFIANRKFLELLNFQVQSINPSKQKSGKSSGVWKQVSERIHGQGYNMYSVVDNSYFEMNTQARKKSMMHGVRRRPRKITASCATIPSRQRYLRQTIDSLIGQVDEIRCYLNGFDDVPSFLNRKKIKVYKSQDHLGDITDRGKFYGCGQIEGYHLTFDDDIIYPPDYVKRMLPYIDSYGGVWSFHGRVLKDKNYFHSFYKGATQFFFHCRFDMNEMRKLDIPGTGVMGYHTDDVRFTMDDFTEDFMCDIMVAVKCKRQGITIRGIPHEKGLFEFANIPRSRTIFGHYRNDDGIQTSYLNAYFRKR